MSPRTGRPKADKPKVIRYSIRLDEQTETKLQNYCNKNSITKGEAIRRGIQMLLSETKKWNRLSHAKDTSLFQPPEEFLINLLYQISSGISIEILGGIKLWNRYKKKYKL